MTRRTRPISRSSSAGSPTTCNSAKPCHQNTEQRRESKAGSSEAGSSTPALTPSPKSPCPRPPNPPAPFVPSGCLAFPDLGSADSPAGPAAPLPRAPPALPHNLLQIPPRRPLPKQTPAVSFACPQRLLLLQPPPEHKKPPLG